MNLNRILPITCLLATALAAVAEEPGRDAAPTPSVRIGNLTFLRAPEDAFARARKEGKLVFAYRMLGELDGLT